MCSCFNVGNKIFCSLRNESLPFWARVHVKGGVKFSKILSRVAYIGVGECSGRFRIFGGEDIGKKELEPIFPIFHRGVSYPEGHYDREHLIQMK